MATAEYNLNQIPYDYTMEVTNRLKGLDLIDKIPEELWMEEPGRLQSMPANLENSAVATGLENVSFHSNPKEGQCQTMFKVPNNCTYFTS